MWFRKVTAEFENGVQLPVIADLSGNFLHATTFFDYFKNAPIFNTCDLLLPRDETLDMTLEDILRAISEEESPEIDFTSA